MKAGTQANAAAVYVKYVHMYIHMNAAPMRYLPYLINFNHEWSPMDAIICLKVSCVT